MYSHWPLHLPLDSPNITLCQLHFVSFDNPLGPISASQIHMGVEPGQPVRDHTPKE